jgi:hypothetical protein
MGLTHAGWMPSFPRMRESGCRGEACLAHGRGARRARKNIAQAGHAAKVGVDKSRMPVRGMP